MTHPIHIASLATGAAGGLLLSCAGPPAILTRDGRPTHDGIVGMCGSAVGMGLLVLSLVLELVSYLAHFDT